MARVSRRLIPFLTLYLPHWFPAKYRAAIVASFMVAMPISTVIGAPISGALLGLRGIRGLDGWQWLFVIEALPAVLMSAVVFFFLTDRTSEAAWLRPDLREWLGDWSRSGVWRRR